MDCGHHKLRQRRRNQYSPLLADAEVFSEQGLSGGGSETNNHLRFDSSDFCLEPGSARCDLRRIRLLVNATFPSGLPFEVLHNICNIGLAAIDAGIFQGLVEQSAGWTYKR